MGDSASIFTPGEVSTYYASRLPRLKQRRASEWRGPCPIHRGKDANFAVDPATGLWYCHSQCARGGDLLDFEMTMTGVDFKAALAAVCAIVGRPMRTRTRMTHGEWRTAREARERERQEQCEALYFADAARVMAEWALEELPDDDPERATHTATLAALRTSPEAEYRAWLEYRPEWTAALVRAGRARAKRLRAMLAGYLSAGVSHAA